MIIPVDKQKAEEIKELHKVRMEAILRVNGASPNLIFVILEEINAYNKELGI